MGYTAGYNFDVSNLDSDFYKKLSVGTPIPNPYRTIDVESTDNASTQIQSALNSLNDLYIDDGVRVVLRLTGVSGSTGDARAGATYHKFNVPVLIDHPVAERLTIEGEAPSDHSIIGVSYYDAVKHAELGISGGYYINSATAATDGFFAQFVVTNGNSLKIGEYLAVYDNRYQKYLNPSFYQFRDPINGRVFATPYPVTAEKLRASLIIGVHKIVDKIDLDQRKEAGTINDLSINPNPGNKVDYVTVHVRNYNPTYSVGLSLYTTTLSRRGYLTPQGIVGRYEQGYGSSTVLEDPLFFSGLSSGISAATGDVAGSLPGYRSSSDFNYGVLKGVGSPSYLTFFNEESDNVLTRNGFSPIPRNRQGLTGVWMDGASEEPVGAEWERYDRLAADSGGNLSIRNYRDSNDFRAKGFKTIIECESDGFIISNNNKPPELKNLLLVSKSGTRGHGIWVDNSSSVNLRQVAVVGFAAGAGVFANNKSTVNGLADKFSDPEVFREVSVFSCNNYSGFESRNHSNINAARSIGAGNLFANYYAAENSYINAYASTSVSSRKYGVAAVGKSFINADSAFSCFNGSDGFFASNGSLLTINAGRACYNYGNGIHAFSSGEVRAFDVIASSNRKDGIVANDMSTIVCGDSSKEPIEWDLYYGYTEPYYNFENPTNISQSKFNGIAGLAASTDSFVNASFFETFHNSRLGGELGRLKDVDCVYTNALGYCFGGGSAGATCDAGYRYCDNAVYAKLYTLSSGSTNDVLNELTPTNVLSPSGNFGVASLCIPYADTTGLTAQVPLSKRRYRYVINGNGSGLPGDANNAGLSAEYQGAGATIGKILACKGILPGCGVQGAFGIVLGSSSLCDPSKNPSEILQGASGTAEQSFVISSDVLACTGDGNSLLLNVICVSQGLDFSTPKRPLSLVIPNYDVEIRDSSKIAFAGRIANFGYYDIKTGVRIQPIYSGSSIGSGLLKPATMIGYSGNKNGSELVITDQTILPSGIFGDQGAISPLDPRDARSAVRYSSEDFLSAAELYDPLSQIGFVNTTPYVINLGKTDPETGALIGEVGTAAAAIAINNTSVTPQQTDSTGYPTY